MKIGEGQLPQYDKSVAAVQKTYGIKCEDVSVEPTLLPSGDKTVEGKEKVIDEKMIKTSIDRANKTLNPLNKVIERTVHEKTGAIMFTIKNTETGEVISEFPPKKIEDMMAKMWELAGLFVDERI